MLLNSISTRGDTATRERATLALLATRLSAALDPVTEIQSILAQQKPSKADERKAAEQAGWEGVS